MKFFAMTLGYFPMTMGGDVWRPIKAEVEAESLHELGDGIKLYVVKAPNGKVFIAEAETGALVGPSLKAVQNDFKTADKKMVQEQIQEAREQASRADVITAEKFWSMLKVNKGENHEHESQVPASQGKARRRRR